MTGFGLRLAEWLRSQPDVTMVRDDTTRYGEAIRCHTDGANWLITLDHCNANDEPDDRRIVSCKYD